MEGFDVPPGNFVGAVPLGLEMNGFLVPVIDGSGDSIHRHDVAHEGRGNPGGVVADEDIFIVNGGHSYIVLEKGGVFREGWGVLGFFTIRLVDSQVMALDVMSWCLNAVLKLAMKTMKVPIVMVEPMRALYRKVVAQVRAGPFVI